ncbi:class I SAM-dependent methyltransferase [Polynucleobacter sp. MWH-CaK5]|uniref:class I SAM-dependent methyltransferase n=1 Tax=Polynucleobacter sp. MWH-CaK5 TaxID=2689107 RepID=UPI001BFD97D0|nr:methyltransferase domain-containing protein [Polynucleobacter sp. MWH-CaK5]QWD89162.1 class I SAM-dependent methyltransferase [Polynucleobacter sp. MWH-CaK5]
MTRNFLKSKYPYLVLNKPHPISEWCGFDRGTPMDRYYIEYFLESQQQLVRGVCLEVLNNTYTTYYGGDNVLSSDVLDIDASNRNATIVGDIRQLDAVDDETFDCIILTQVLQFIDNLDASISECNRVLKTGGVLLVTLPAIGRVDSISGVHGDYWRFTTASAKYIFEKKFSRDKVLIKSFGNVRSAMLFYAGMAIEDISKSVLDVVDENFPMIIAVKAIK